MGRFPSGNIDSDVLIWKYSCKRICFSSLFAERISVPIGFVALINRNGRATTIFEGSVEYVSKWADVYFVRTRVNEQQMWGVRDIPCIDPDSGLVMPMGISGLFVFNVEYPDRLVRQTAGHVDVMSVRYFMRQMLLPRLRLAIKVILECDIPERNLVVVKERIMDNIESILNVFDEYGLVLADNTFTVSNLA